MYYYLIPAGIIGGSLVTILVIIIRKFPQITRVDVATLPLEKEARKKKEIIEKRVEEHSQELKKTWQQRLEPFRKLWGRVQLKFRVYVGHIEKLWYHEHAKKIVNPEEELTPDQQEEKFSSLIQEAQECLKK
jgi:hypothetical protein